MSETVWQDVEFGDFIEDFPIWRKLADEEGEGDPIAVLDIGAGVGRVSIDLARAEHNVTALDSDPELLDELERRASKADVVVRTLVKDARDFKTRSKFNLVLAPMQLLQLLGPDDQRAGFYESVAGALRPGGLLALALVDLSGEPTGEAYGPPLPDMHDVDGWVYASQPLMIRFDEGGKEVIVLERMRTVVSPAGKITEQPNTIALHVVGPDRCEREAAEAGFEPEGRIAIPPTDRYVGSVVVLLRLAG